MDWALGKLQSSSLAAIFLPMDFYDYYFVCPQRSYVEEHLKGSGAAGSGRQFSAEKWACDTWPMIMAAEYHNYVRARVGRPAGRRWLPTSEGNSSEIISCKHWPQTGGCPLLCHCRIDCQHAQPAAEEALSVPLSAWLGAELTRKRNPLTGGRASGTHRVASVE